MSEPGRVVARFRRHGLVENADGERYVCQFKGRAVRPMVGDRVEWNNEPDGTGTVTAVLPRTSELTRINNRGQPEILAANVSQLVIVLAIRPAPDWFLLDRYLSAAELAGLKSIVVLNKKDLNGNRPEQLSLYQDLGYPVYLTSAIRPSGLAELARAMRTERSAMIGQSGVGKSSLINALAPDAEQAVRALSDKGGHGRHTTTTAVLHRLENGGELIDSPGVRDYAPYIEEARDAQRGFREFAERIGKCRFDNCLHLAEPDCAIKAATQAGEISPARYESYRKLYSLTASFEKRRG